MIIGTTHYLDYRGGVLHPALSMDSNTPFHGVPDSRPKEVAIFICTNWSEDENTWEAGSKVPQWVRDRLSKCQPKNLGQFVGKKMFETVR